VTSRHAINRGLAHKNEHRAAPLVRFSHFQAITISFGATKGI
jgi:hypothetical protein